VNNRRALFIGVEKMSDELKTDWFCPKCNCYIDGHQVTNDERHETCGTYLGESVQELRAEIDRLKEERRRDALDGQCALDEANNAVIKYKSLADELAGVLEGWKRFHKDCDKGRVDAENATDYYEYTKNKAEAALKKYHELTEEEK
jgi:hypothetical protein